MWATPAVLVALVAATVGEAPETDTTAKAPTSATTRKIPTAAIEMSNHAAQLSGRLASDASASLLAAFKQLTAAVAALRTEALKGRVSVYKQALDMSGRYTNDIPLLGPAMVMGTSTLKTAADLMTNIKQSAISASHSLATANMEALDKVIQAQAAAFMSASNASASAIAHGLHSASASVDGAANRSAVALAAASGALGGRASTTVRPSWNPYVDLFD